MNPHHTSRPSSLAAIVLALLLIVTACGGSSDSAGSSADSASGSSSSNSSSDGPPGDACNLLSDDFVAGLLNTQGESSSYFDVLDPTYTDHCEWLVKDFDGEFPGEVEIIEIHIYNPGYFADDNAFVGAELTPLTTEGAVVSTFLDSLHRLQIARNGVEIEASLSFAGLPDLAEASAQLELVAAEIDRNS